MTANIAAPQDFNAVFSHNRAHVSARKIFMTVQDSALTYGQLDDLTARAAVFFQNRNLQQGQRAILLTRDNMALVVLFMACLRYGLSAVILNPDAGAEETATLIRAAKPSALFMDQDLLEKFSLTGTVTLPITPFADARKPGLFSKKGDPGTYPQCLFKHEPAKNFASIPPETTAYILFTSGTTSRPKGVEITHANLLAQMNTFVRHYGYDENTALLNVLPLHHTDGLTQGPVVAFMAGASVHRPLRFAVNRLPDLLDALYKYKITHFIAVPAMLQLIDALGDDHDAAFKTEFFKYVISTAGYLDPGLWERFEKRFGVMIVNVYGLTETVCEALYCGPTPETRKIGTIGKPVDTQCRIVDDSGQDAPEGKTGELWLKGPHIMKGYFELPEETTAVLSIDGWLRTGDLCKRDEDGFYHIVGRKKNVIIVGGTNIYPDDVANILRALPGVLDAAVWGEDDPVWGETVAAAVLPKDGALLDEKKLAEEFVKIGSLEMLPRRIHIASDFPRGPAGKVVIRDLRAQIAKKQESRAKTRTPGQDLATRVLTAAAQSFRCPVETLTLDSKAETTKGWNSLAHVELILNLEKEFSIRIDPREILTIRSLNDALTIVRNKKQASA